MEVVSNKPETFAVQQVQGSAGGEYVSANVGVVGLVL